MTEQPTANVQLTFDQQQAIDTATKRLTNIQNESSSASKLLGEIRNDTDRITKEKEYQQSVLDGLNADISTAIRHRDELVAINNSILQANTEVQRHSDDLVTANDSKALELKDREDAVTARELDVTAKESELDRKLKQLEEDSKNVADKKATIQSIIDSI